MKHLGLLFLLLLLAVSCSGPKSSQDVTDEPAGLELSEEEDLFAEDDFDESMDEIEQNEEVAEVSAEEPEEMEMSESFEPEESKEMMAMSESSESNNSSSDIVIEEEGSMKSYTVEKNDTLMLISFKVYGDYSKWKKILMANEKLKGNPANMKEGMELMYPHSGEEFSWNPEGNPYLIKWGDTLGLISGKVYGTKKKWKYIWDNNKPMIKDPNKIYAGFTLYYLEDDRGVASN